MSGEINQVIYEGGKMKDEALQSWANAMFHHYQKHLETNIWHQPSGQHGFDKVKHPRNLLQNVQPDQG